MVFVRDSPFPRGFLSSWRRRDRHRYVQEDADKAGRHQLGDHQAHEARVSVNPSCLVWDSCQPIKQKRGDHLTSVRDRFPLMGRLNSRYRHDCHKQVQARAEEDQGTSLYLGQRGRQAHQHRKRQQPCQATRPFVASQYGT